MIIIYYFNDFYCNLIVVAADGSISLFFNSSVFIFASAKIVESGESTLSNIK